MTGLTASRTRTEYVKHIGYDEFEQRKRVTVGNGITTTYSYDPMTRRLVGIQASQRDPALVAAGAPARPFQQVSYQYDLVGNVTQIANTAPVDPTQTGTVRVGPLTENFSYDDLCVLELAALGAFLNSPAGQRTMLALQVGIAAGAGALAAGASTWWSKAHGGDSPPPPPPPPPAPPPPAEPPPPPPPPAGPPGIPPGAAVPLAAAAAAANTPAGREAIQEGQRWRARPAQRFQMRHKTLQTPPQGG